jgi:hypothetical protein
MSRRHQPKVNPVKSEPSPWTEPFQQAHSTYATPDAQAGRANSSAEQATPAGQSQNAEDQRNELTRNALSASFGQ